MKVDGEGGFHAHRPAIYAVGLKAPPLHGIDSSGGQRCGTADRTHMGHGAIGGDNRLQYDYTSQLRLGRLWRINRFDLMHYESINHFTGEPNRIIDRSPVELPFGGRFFKRYRRFQLLPRAAPVPPAKSRGEDRNDDCCRQKGSE